MIGRWAGENPGLALIALAVLAWAFGFWPLAILLGLVSLVGPAALITLATHWGEAGSLARGATYLAGLVGCWAAVSVRWRPWHAAVALAGALAVSMWRHRRDRRLEPARQHIERTIVPLHNALAPEFGIDPRNLDPLAWLDVPIGGIDAEGGVVITLPTDRVPSEPKKREVERIVAAKLGLTGYKADWRLNDANRHLHLSAAPPEPKVPAMVRFADVFDDVIAKAKVPAPALALGLSDRPITVDWETETPHVLFSCRTGWGKSSAVGLMAAHVLHHGGDVVIPDIKVISLEPFEGLPGVTYADDIEGIHLTLAQVGRVIAWRNREMKRRKRAGEKRPDFPRLLVILEELNACRDELADYWQEVREPSDPKTSPAIKAYRHMLLMGRAVNVNCIAITQSGTAHAVGGPAYREQYGTRILGWYTKNAWNMLIPEHPYVMATDRPGHGWIARGRHAREAQFIYATEDELVAYATSGRPPAGAMSQLPQADGPFSPEAGPEAGAAGAAPALPHLALVSGDDEEEADEPISLREASQDHGGPDAVVSLTLDQLQTDRKRYRSEFPNPLFRATNGTDYYDRSDLVDWERRRPVGRRRKAAEA